MILFFATSFPSVCKVIKKKNPPPPKQKPKKDSKVNLNMKKVVFFYALSGLFAGAIFSSFICGIPTNYKPENDCNLFGSKGKKPLTIMSQTILNGFLILAIKFVHYLFSRSYKSSTPYTMIVPFWVAFTLSVSYMSELPLS